MKKVQVEICKRSGSRETVTAYQHSDKLAIHKDGYKYWTVAHIPTGHAFHWTCERRKDAILIADEIVAFFGEIPDTEDAIRQAMRDEGGFYYYLLTVARWGSGIGSGHSSYTPAMTYKEYKNQ